MNKGMKEIERKREEEQNQTFRVWFSPTLRKAMEGRRHHLVRFWLLHVVITTDDAYMRYICSITMMNVSTIYYLC